ncbi:Uncharacterised protein [Mycobacteroides abscessus]|nr:Uncharacterised protein [Mycobacteroides abscessus]
MASRHERLGEVAHVELHAAGGVERVGAHDAHAQAHAARSASGDGSPAAARVRA